MQENHVVQVIWVLILYVKNYDYVMNINFEHSEKQCSLPSNEVHESCHSCWDFT